MEIDWEKHHHYMPWAGACGPTVIKMIFSVADIKKSILEISLYTWKWWYGCPNQLFSAYLSKFFSLTNYKLNGSIADISRHLKMGHIVVVNFWDNTDGHYAIISECKKGILTVIDPSREREWRYTIATKEFKKIWYDYLDTINTIYHEGLLIWVDVNSKR